MKILSERLKDKFHGDAELAEWDMEFEEKNKFNYGEKSKIYKWHSLRSWTNNKNLTFYIIS